MKLKISATISLVGLLAAGAAQAQQPQANPPSGITAPRDAGQHPKTVKAAASKKKSDLQKTAANSLPPSQDGLPCPQAKWKNDPVCADLPDEHTLPAPSSHSAAPLAIGGPPKVAVPGVNNLSVSPDIQANNNPRLPGYDSVPMLDSVKRTMPDATEASPGSRMGLSFGLQF